MNRINIKSRLDKLGYAFGGNPVIAILHIAEDGRHVVVEQYVNAPDRIRAYSDREDYESKYPLKEKALHILFDDGDGTYEGFIFPETASA
jgi:hypothetical protein